MAEIEILAQKIQDSAMERIFILEGRAGRGNKLSSRHKPAFLGVGTRVLKYKKDRGATIWNSMTLADTIIQRKRKTSNLITNFVTPKKQK